MTPQELFDEGMKAAIDARVTIDHTRMDEEGFQPSDPQPPPKPGDPVTVRRFAARRS